MVIIEVSNKRHFKQFLNLPYQLYKNDPDWVPPLRSEQKKLFLPQKNPTLAHCDFCLYLLLDDERPIGRVAAFIDKHFNNYWKNRIGFFGSYECVKDYGASQILLDTCKQWLSEREMTHWFFNCFA